MKVFAELSFDGKFAIERFVQSDTAPEPTGVNVIALLKCTPEGKFSLLKRSDEHGDEYSIVRHVQGEPLVVKCELPKKIEAKRVPKPLSGKRGGQLKKKRNDKPKVTFRV